MEPDRLSDLTGLRVLLLEDEALVAMLAESMLEDLGCQVIGPAMRNAQAIALAESGQPIDAALLDVNVHSETAFPAAEALRRRGVPVAFATGYGQAGLPPEWADAPTLQKPYALDQLREVLGTLMGRTRA